MVATRPGDDPVPRAGEGGSRRTAAQLASDPAFTGTYARRFARAALPPLWPSTGQNLAPAADIPTFATSGPGGVPPITGGWTSQQAQYDDPRIVGLGTVDGTVVDAGGSVHYLQNQVSGLTGSGATPCARTFDYYGSDLAIWFRNAVSSNSRFWVWVDGQPTTAAPQASTAASANSMFFYRLTWGAARMRRLTIYTENADWGGIACAFTDTISTGVKPATSLLVVGDSYVAGTAATTGLQGFAFTLGRALGAEVYCAAQPGTGYTQGVTFGNASRLAKVAGLSPTWIVMAGSINDSAASASAVQTAAQTAMAAYQAACPSARLAVLSVQDNAGTMSGANIANDAAVAAAASAAGAAFVSRPISENWITGTGRVGATANDGNADVFVSSDGIHLTTAGHDYYARRLYSAFQSYYATA